MKPLLTHLFLIVLLFLIALPAGASTRRKPRPAPEAPGLPQAYRVDVPARNYRELGPLPNLASPAENGELLLSVSRWEADGIDLPGSRLPETSPFKTASTPTFGLGWGMPPWRRGSAVEILGFGQAKLSQLDRTGRSLSSPEVESQGMTFLSARIGAELRPRLLSFRWIGFYLAPEFGPALALTERSTLEDGSTELGIQGAGRLGIATASLKVLGTPMSLDMNFEQTFGSMNSATLSGRALGLGLRVTL